MKTIEAAERAQTGASLRLEAEYQNKCLKEMGGDTVSAGREGLLRAGCPLCTLMGPKRGGYRSK